MDLAKKEAKKAYLLNEIPVGAILVDNATNLPISSAHNEVIKQKNSTKHTNTHIFQKGACQKNLKKSKIEKTFDQRPSKYPNLDWL